MATAEHGSRVTREGHARFWERPEVKFLRATRQRAVRVGWRADLVLLRVGWRLRAESSIPCVRGIN